MSFPPRNIPGCNARFQPPALFAELRNDSPSGLQIRVTFWPPSATLVFFSRRGNIMCVVILPHQEFPSGHGTLLQNCITPAIAKHLFSSPFTHFRRKMQVPTHQGNNPGTRECHHHCHSLLKRTYKSPMLYGFCKLSPVTSPLPSSASRLPAQLR